MKFVRLAILNFEPFPENWLPFTMSAGEVQLQTISSLSSVEKRRLCVFAMVELEDTLALTDNNQIVIPEVARKRTENVIEGIASAIAVAENCAPTISSPEPCAALIPEDAQERSFLEATDGIAVDHNRRAFGKGVYRVPRDIIVQAMESRLDGIILLAEGLSQEHPTGRLHEFVRLFELAFALSSTNLVEALAKFLSASDLGYTEDEVRLWIKELRDPATHADGKYHADFALQSDVRPAISRMEQAAYDVLLNKVDWHNPSTQRKEVWRPFAGTLGMNADVFIVKGKDVKIQFQLLDGFCAYPLNLEAAIPRLPDEWWSRWAQK